MLAGVWEVMRVYGCWGRWAEVVDLREGEGEGLVVGFVRVGGRRGHT